MPCQLHLYGKSVRVIHNRISKIDRRWIYCCLDEIVISVSEINWNWMRTLRAILRGNGFWFGRLKESNGLHLILVELTHCDFRGMLCR